MIKKIIYILILVGTIAAVVFAVIDAKNSRSLLPNLMQSGEKSAVEMPDSVLSADSLQITE